MRFESAACLVLAAAGALAPCAPAQNLAQTGAEGEVTDSRYIQPKWKMQFEASAWYVSPGGEIQAPGSGGELRTEALNLDSPRPAPYGELHLRDGNWRLAFGGAAFSLEGRGAILEESGSFGGVSYEAGERAVSALDFTTVHGEVGYRLPISGLLAGQNIPDFYATWEAIGGVRIIDVDLDVSFPGGTSDTHEFFVSPYVGIRLAMEMIHRFSVDVQTSFGAYGAGDRSMFTGDIAAGFQWRPVENIGIQAGYRMLFFDLDAGSGDDQFHWSGSVAGIYGGIVLRF